MTRRKRRNHSPTFKAASAGSVPFLNLLGIVAGGWQMARAALVAADRLDEGKGKGSADFYQAKIITARFYADHVLSQDQKGSAQKRKRPTFWLAFSL